ncbi:MULTISPECIES: MaoC family dehydratase [Reichenbachiella]|uniref:3-hydroxybutyryl-CoA dehydratase n=1 Tax=Reichenbachiella agariperforans TaxID=156994 RepID=A0A1M6P6Q0_REIAG|nr:MULTISPECIES: MaoC family dehydratase [Reichenbachiella]MBU2914646.1 MaoC family dehydratase [Reichenbachiella agariperforans]RJE71572.1 dehydrogenase [Reichenbachiella sp. MSK19-1]SHK03667.1 3-hydroxybutyryl-CoA dehydratase [Reichenbachiella agariperforans]
MLKVGDQYTTDFTITQDQIAAFAELSGDKNPLHLDAEYAAETPFKKPIAHGIFSASFISKVLGMDFPGEGTLYLSQNLSFKRPVYPDQAYEVRLEITETVEGKHTGTIKTQIFDKEKNKLVVDGEAQVRHLDKLP